MSLSPPKPQSGTSVWDIKQEQSPHLIPPTPVRLSREEVGARLKTGCLETWQLQFQGTCSWFFRCLELTSKSLVTMKWCEWNLALFCSTSFYPALVHFEILMFNLIYLDSLSKFNHFQPPHLLISDRHYVFSHISVHLLLHLCKISICRSVEMLAF